MKRGPSPEEARQILRSVNDGVVPLDLVHWFSVGRRKQLVIVAKGLDSTEGGKSRMLFVDGTYGAGKTHFLGLVTRQALKRRFLVTHVVLTPRECPLSSLTAIYRAILRGLRSPECPQRPAISDILERWLTLCMKTVLTPEHLTRTCKHGLTYETCAYNCKDILFREYLEALSEVSGSFAAIVKIYQHALDKRNTNVLGLAERLLLGHRLDKRDIRRLGDYLPGCAATDNITEASAIGGFQDLAHFARIVGYRGLVVMLDEAESLPSVYERGMGKFQAFANLITLAAKAMELRHLYFVYATTPQFDQEVNWVSSQVLGDDMDRKKALLGLLNTRLQLPNLTREECCELGRKVRNIAVAAYGRDIPECEVDRAAADIFSAIPPATFTVRTFLTQLVPWIRSLASQHT